MITITCTCGRRYRVKDDHAGKRTRCPVCGAALVVPLIFPAPSGDDLRVIPLPPPPVPEPHPLPPPPPPPNPPAGKPGKRPAISWRPTWDRMPIYTVMGFTVVLLGVMVWWMPGSPKPEPLPAPEVIRTPTQGFPRLKVVVPAYFYPGGSGLKEWERLIEAANDIPVVVVANASSGPGDEVNTDYAGIIRQANWRGVTVVGYVNTDYGHRPQADVQGDVDRWVQLYPEVKGMFLDSQPSEPGHSAYYAAVCDHIRKKVRDGLVISNPGAICDEEYATKLDPVALCLFVGSARFGDFRLPRWAEMHPTARFMAMPNNVSSPEQMKEFVQVAPRRGIGLIYVTDAKSPKLWDHLPSYWDAEVDAIRRVNSGQSP